MPAAQLHVNVASVGVLHVLPFLHGLLEQAETSTMTKKKKSRYVKKMMFIFNDFRFFCYCNFGVPLSGPLITLARRLTPRGQSLVVRLYFRIEILNKTRRIENRD